MKQHHEILNKKRTIKKKKTHISGLSFYKNLIW